MSEGGAVSRASVIVVTRNRPLLLADALAGVKRQAPPPHEVRIADDGEDPAQPVAAASGLEATVIVVAARAPGAARNRAAEGASGAWLAFLDDDDRWLPGHLEGFARVFADPEVQVAYRDCVVVRERVEGGRRIDLERRGIARDWDLAVMGENDYVPPSALAIRRGLFERLQGFDPAFAFSEDWDLLLRAAAVTVPRRVPGATVEIRMRDAGHASADGPGRRACLDRLRERHRLQALAIKTFWEVARDVAPAQAAPR